MIRIPANGPAPPLKWWGNAFVRVWADRMQLVIVLRLPWWRETVRATPPSGNYTMTWLQSEQLMLSWRQGEGWRKGWRAA